MSMQDDSSESSAQHSQSYENELWRQKRVMRLATIQLAMIPVYVVTIMLILPIRGILNKQEQIMSAQLQGMQKVPELEKKIAKLESQINLLTTESVDSRIRILEKSLNTANLKPEEIASLNQLREDLTRIKTYMFNDPREVVEFKEMQRDYHNLAAAQSQFATKEAMQSGMATVQWIFGLLIGVLYTIYFGSWWFASRKSIPQETKPVTSPVSPTPTRGRSDLSGEGRQ